MNEGIGITRQPADGHEQRPARFRDLSLFLLPLLLLLAAAIAFLIAGSGGGDTPDVAAERTPSATVTPSSVTRTETPGGAADSPRPRPRRTPTPSPTGADATPPPAGTPLPPSPSPTPATETGDVAIVPVVRFWSPETSISLRELGRALEGRSRDFERVIVPADDSDSIAAALGVTIAPAVETGDAARIRDAVRNGALGLLRLADVTPAVKALAIDDHHLFGNGRLGDLADWPLTILAVEESGRKWEQSESWTLVAAGDIMLDRGVALELRRRGGDADFPFDGGTAEITGYSCCSGFGHPVPRDRRTGNRGAMRAMLSDADLALANLESSVVRNARLHRSGFTFTADPSLLLGIRNAGIDFLSLANNHIGDGGRTGMRTAMRELDELGIAHAGLGRDVEAAGRPARLDANGYTVAVLPCDAHARGYWAREDRLGALPCRGPTLRNAIRDASAQADVVIVFPHWGAEYGARPNAAQRRQAARWIDHGADLVIGAHSHWAGAVEEIGDGLVFYSLGNFVFDQDWSEQTMLGVVVELTFQGDRLVQAWLHPTLILDDAQPNFLDPARDGARVLRQMREGSEGLLDY